MDFLSLNSLSSSLYQVSVTSLNVLICALSGPRISKNGRKTQEPNTDVATKIWVSPTVSHFTSARVSNRAKMCSTCRLHTPSKSAHNPLYPFLNQSTQNSWCQNKSSYQQVLLFSNSLYFPPFLHWQITLCQATMCVPICARTCAGVCIQAEA